jgi:hypothetical protein
MKKKKTDSFPRFKLFREIAEIARQRPVPNGTYFLDHNVAYEEIKKIFEPKDLASENNIFSEREDQLGLIAVEITISSILTSTNLEFYFELAHTLRDAIRPLKTTPLFTLSDERWIEALRIALIYLENKDPQSTSPFKHSHRHITFAHAVRFFRRKNIHFPVVGDKAQIHQKSVTDMIVELVYRPLAALGDVGSMTAINAQLMGRYDLSLQRVRMHPTPDAMGRKMDRSLPFGYLYRLGIRTLGRRRDIVLPKRMLDSLTDALVSLAALYDVEPFSIYDFMFPPLRQRSLEVLRDVTTYDEIFTVPQCHPDLIEDILGHLFKNIFNRKLFKDIDWHLNDAVEFWKLLVQILPSNGSSLFIKNSELTQLLTQRIGSLAAEKLLAGFILQNPNSVYRLPTDAGTANTRECALAKATNDRVWIAPLPFIGPAFFSRLVTLCGRIDQSVHEQIGKNFEERLYERMQNIGISCRRGNIGTSKNILGEADLILETAETIALFELKKKGLSRSTNAGNDLQLAADLARGAIHAVNQLGKLEALLVETGKLMFVDGTELYRGERRIIKVVVSLADHGGLHDSAVFRNMLDSLRGAVLTGNRKLTIDQERSLVVANKELDTLQKHYLRFEELKEVGVLNSFSDNVIFHNIYFIEHLLKCIQDPEELISELLRGHRIITGTRDAFVDFALFQPSKQRL